MAPITPLSDARALRERLARVDRFLADQYIQSGRLAGALVQVWRRDERVLNSLQGMADRERGLPMAEDTIFRIYSMSKPITSVALMMLFEQGQVALDDPVAKYIPAWAHLQVYAGGELGTFKTRPPARPMQIIDLLRHTSGLTYGFQNATPVDAAYRKLKLGEMNHTGTLDEMVAALADVPLDFAPGEAWNYSVSTDILGYLVSKISGLPFETFLHERIFGPLGMVDTGFHVPAQKAQRLAACYTIGPLGRAVAPDSRFTLQDDPQTSNYLQPPRFFSGGGGLVSTAADYMRFARMLLGGGTLDGVHLLGRKTLELMTANHLPGGVDLPQLSRSMFSEAAYNGVGFGLGFATTLDPARTLTLGSAGDFFWGGAASTFFVVDPREELVTLLMTQLIPSSAYPLRRQLRTLVYGAL
ncbi:MAG: beta-lactamase family protein [Burkholderiaceae bacterium]|jgi:CubicO group peptidase (beta-lactamase class C family)|nr:beta-lactamase family protein [Burkholderiaceae bacterium]